MKELPIEPEDLISRLYGNSEYKQRNRNFGSLEEVDSVYETDESILFAIFETRASKTVGGCPGCGRPFEMFKKVLKKQAYRCKCGYKVYPLKGTHLEQSRAGLKYSLHLIYELFCSKNGSPATMLQRRTGKEYETCWANLHKISDWMGYYNHWRKFTPGSTLQMDVVYPICKTGRGKYAKNKKGLGSERTIAVLFISEADQPEIGFKGVTKGFHFEKNNFKALEKLIKEQVKSEDKHLIYTDGGTEFEFLTSNKYMVHTVNHRSTEFKGKYAKEIVDHSGNKRICTTNTVEGNNNTVKTTIHRVYRTISPEYAQFYTERIAFNQTNKSRNFFETFNELLQCLPGFTDSVTRNFKLKKRVRPDKVSYGSAA